MTTKNDAATKQKAQEFADALARLCAEYGYALQPQLFWKQQIDGTFTVGVNIIAVERKEAKE